ncbi:protein CHROMATIN REMODELING 24-like isoform X2 [Cornus florida]|uniref:protein CHROMATIN REMODELING 24-like isoform X2 n=1 Tax=Cornus florida TaxID=4283 RepID=UPI00289DB6ED|nr:protein CHROMATIN REMODELING 24-like isoform X2 [Cornus florida]XP_059670423.1 protein CHROMATIN REMODELING 24-like isoform X2 [Cornus florida]
MGMSGVGENIAFSEVKWDYMFLDEELWGLLKICCPDLFGDWKSFRGDYERYISRALHKNATNSYKRLGAKVAVVYLLGRAKKLMGMSGVGKKIDFQDSQLGWYRLEHNPTSWLPIRTIPAI